MAAESGREDLMYFANALREYLGLAPLPTQDGRAPRARGPRMFGVEREWPAFGVFRSEGEAERTAALRRS